MVIGTAAAILGGAAISGIIGGISSSSAASKAASVSQNATDSNNALAANIYSQNKATLAPFVGQGGAATSYINQLLGLGGPSGADSPAMTAFAGYRGADGYQFRVNQGTQAVTNSAAVKGSLNSGATLKALQTYGQNTASSEFGTYLANLRDQQNVGLSAASAQAGVSNTYSSQVQGNNSSNATNQGNAAIAQGNAISNGVNGVANTASYLYGLGKLG